MSLVYSILAILACGAIGALAGVGVIELTRIDGVAGALTAVVTGMLAAALAWIGGVALMVKLGILK